MKNIFGIYDIGVLSGGNCNNGASAGSAYFNANNDLGNANWNYASRIINKIV